MSLFGLRLSPQVVGAWVLVLSPLLGTLIVSLFLLSQLNMLDPVRWCGVAVGTAKVAGNGGRMEDTRACFDLLRDMLSVYRTNTLALIVILGATIIASVVTALKVRIEINGPMGWSTRFGRDAASAEAPHPTPPPGETGR